MSVFRIASRYAKSLLDLSVEKNALDEVVKNMQNFHSICVENNDFVLMLKNPVINSGKKQTILKAAFEGKVTELTMAFIDIVVRKKREKFLPEIAEIFIQQYHAYMGIVESTVTTVLPLTAAMKKEVIDIVEKITSKKVDLTEKIDKSLIGGFVLRIGDKQIDDSISSKLRELRLELIDSHHYESKI
ncbi:MAG: ATP synthase F1 subunit delta [Reichenbachiella sp.]